MHLEEVTERTPPAAFSFTLLGGGHPCPPEDSGGPFGYNARRLALDDPTHPEHEQLRAWAGKKFESSVFDTTAIQRALTKFVPTTRSKMSVEPQSKLKQH